MFVNVNETVESFGKMFIRSMECAFSRDGDYKKEWLDRDFELDFCRTPHLDCNTIDNSKVELHPAKKFEYRKRLSEIEKILRKLGTCRSYLNSMEYSLQTEIAEISKHLVVEYDVEKLRRTANYYFKYVRIVKYADRIKEEDCEKDISYFNQILRQCLGEGQLFEVIDLWYETDYEGLSIHFTVPQVLGHFKLNLPFPTEYKPSCDHYCGKYHEASPLPMEASIDYTLPFHHSYTSILHGWDFDEIRKCWKEFDLKSLTKRYLNTDIEKDVNGHVIIEHRDFKEILDFAVREHVRDIPENAREADRNMRIAWEYMNKGNES